MRMDENLTRFNSLFAGDGPNRLFVYFQAADRADEVMCRGRNMLLMLVFRPHGGTSDIPWYAALSVTVLIVPLLREEHTGTTR